jgi:hypothetical protein
MKIHLKPYAKPVKRRPYPIKSQVQGKGAQRFGLDVGCYGIIALVEESDWISPMVVKPKKISDIQSV